VAKLHSKQLGSIGEMMVAADLMSCGYAVFFELGDLSKTDLIAIIDNKPIRIQVKTSTLKMGRAALDLKKSGPNYKFKYTTEDVDIFALYIPNHGVGYFSSEFCNTHSVGLTIRISRPLNKQSKNCRLLKDYSDIKKALRGHTPTTLTDNAEGDEMVQTTSQ